MKAVKLHCGSKGPTDSRPIKRVNVKFQNLILLNQKYTYLQIVDTFSYGFRKYSTI